tara:strand:+ start:391 stop:564 length:174 start_codon:yes stop_codon:yes gene_type:complete
MTEAERIEKVISDYESATQKIYMVATRVESQVGRPAGVKNYEPTVFCYQPEIEGAPI